MKTPLWLMYVADNRLASKGRKGDTKIRNVAGKKSHVNPVEAKIIDSYGGVGEALVQSAGAGTANPKTGLPEYHSKWYPHSHWQPFKDPFDLNLDAGEALELTGMMFEELGTFVTGGDATESNFGIDYTDAGAIDQIVWIVENPDVIYDFEEYAKRKEGEWEMDSRMMNFNLDEYKTHQGLGTLDDYWAELGIPEEDRAFFESGLNPEYIGTGDQKGFFEQQADISRFTTEGTWTADQNQYGVSEAIGAEGYRAGQSDYTTGLSELAEMYRSGQTSYSIGQDIGAEAFRFGTEDISIGREEVSEAYRSGAMDIATSRTEGLSAWQAGQDQYTIGMDEMGEGRRAAAEAYSISGDIGGAGFRTGQRAFDIAGMGITEGRTAAAEAYKIAGKGMEEGMAASQKSYDIGGLEIGEALRAGLSAYEIGSAGVAETRRATAEQYGTGIEGEGVGLQTQKIRRGQQRSLISLGEAAEAGASRAGFAGGGTGARRAERARGNLWEDFGQQQKELEAAKTGALTRADLQQQSLESSRIGLESAYGTAIRDAEGNITGTTGGTAQARREEAFRAARAQYGEGGLMDISRIEAERAAGAIYGGEGLPQGIAQAQQASAWSAITDQYGAEGGGGYFQRQRAEDLARAGAQYGQTVDGVFQEGFGGKRLESSYTALKSKYGTETDGVWGGGGGTYEARLANRESGMTSMYGDRDAQGNIISGPGGTAGRRYTNVESGLGSMYGDRDAQGNILSGSGGTYERGLSNVLAGVTSITGEWTGGADSQYVEGSGGTGYTRNQSAWAGTQSKYGPQQFDESGAYTGGGTYMRGADITRDRASTAYEAAMGWTDEGGTSYAGSIGLGTSMAKSDFFHDVGTDYWDLLMQYDAYKRGQT